ncbi:MAG: galactose-1-phosphate uridylyltransferase [Fimbriimonadaceae bacterium]
MSELRYHPFLRTWVITATHRQDRTFHPPDDYCPLCPTKPGGFPTEVPVPNYDIAVFENKFPSLSPTPPDPEIESSDLVPVRPANGACEVVCYSSEHRATFASLPLSQIRKLVRVWRERYIELAAREDVEYVFIFENKGKEIGVTLSHPHGQIYAYPFIPATLMAELESEKDHYAKTGTTLFCDWLNEELKGPRIVHENNSFLAIVPVFARYPYEVWVVPREQRRSLAELLPIEQDEFAEILQLVTQKYDRLFGFSLPYIMAMHQEPAVPGYEFNWLHVEFYPPYRTAEKLKYLAGSESGAGAWINDTLPEVTAARLREL